MTMKDPFASLKTMLARVDETPVRGGTILTEPGPTPGTPPSSPNTATGIGRVLTWLVNALGLLGQSIPTTLKNDFVRPTIDVFNNGWAFMIPDEIQFTGVAPGGGVAVATGRDTNVRQILDMSLNHTAGAGPVLANIYLINNQGLGNKIFLKSVSIAAATILGMADLLGGTRVLIPPGYQLSLDMPVLAGGDTLVWTVLTARLPTGSGL